MKNLLTLFCLCALLLSAACRTAPALEPEATLPPTQTQPPPTQPPAVPTETAAPPTETAEPLTATAEPATATTTPMETDQPAVGVPPINEAGVLDSDDFSIGTVAGVADSWFVSTVSGIPYQEDLPPPLRGWPPHLFVTFEEAGRPAADVNNFTMTAPQGRIFPVEAYREMSDAAGREFIGQWIDELRTILEERPQTFPDQNSIPVLPDVGATQDFRGKISYIDFTGGSGIGFIGHYGQDLGPFTGESLAYFFQGLTSDGEHYLSFVQPLTANFLPESFTDVPQETLDLLNTDPQAYLQEVTGQIEGAESSDFTPNLDALVAMYSSIVIGESAPALSFRSSQPPAIP